MKSFLLTTLWLLSFLLIASCSKNQDQAQPTPVESINADSISFSTILVNCKSYDSTINGIAVFDIQNYFLSKTIVKSTINGKLLSFTRSELASYFTTINQLVTDFQISQSYYLNYSSFADLVEDKLKAKTGFQKTYTLSPQQIEQLVNKETVTVAYLGSGFSNSLFASRLYAISNLGLFLLNTFMSPTVSNFSINNLLATMSIGVKIAGSSENYSTLGKLINYKSTNKTTIAATSITSNQFTYSNYQYNTYKDGAGFTGPPIIYDAPAWYWHQYKTPTNSTGVIDLGPPDITVQNFTISDFSKTLIPLSLNSNAKINGSAVELSYAGGNASSSDVTLKQFSDLKNGFESTIEFSLLKATSLILQTKLGNKGGNFYNGIGLNILPIDNTKDYADGLFILPGTKTANIKDFIKVVDGNKHTLKMALQSSASSMLAQVYLDNTLVATQPYSLSFYNYNIQILKDTDAKRLIGLLAFDSGSGTIKIYSWQFKAY